VFRTSGTTSAERGSHPLRDLSLYDRGAKAAASYALFPDAPRLRLVVLAPSEAEAPDSSLSYMLARFLHWFGDDESEYVLRGGALQVDALRQALAKATSVRTPVALLGTSFAFVHAQDALGEQRFVLPPGSRIMQTGGFKGRSRSIEPAAMLQMLSARFGIASDWIVQEYGMTELSSQLYETTLRRAALGEASTERHLWVPGWVRAEPIDPETLQPTAAGEVGLLRIDDLANLDGVCAIQTSDLARRVQAGVVVLGRAADAAVRGCSIGADELLGG
jgi:acyl-CoA synthetase (AMP-forming)/AMP-acid ligase II